MHHREHACVGTRVQGVYLGSTCEPAQVAGMCRPIQCDISRYGEECSAGNACVAACHAAGCGAGMFTRTAQGQFWTLAWGTVRPASRRNGPEQGDLAPCSWGLPVQGLGWCFPEASSGSPVSWSAPVYILPAPLRLPQTHLCRRELGTGWVGDGGAVQAQAAALPRRLGGAAWMGSLLCSCRSSDPDTV